MAMSLALKPQHDQAVENQGHRGRTPDRLLLALGQALAVTVQEKRDRQTPSLGGDPEEVHDDWGQDDPIVPPTDAGLGPAGDQGW